jgi:hypothetical protein
MPLVERKCPACGQIKKFRSDVKTCGCGGTNPFKKPAAPKPGKPTKVELTADQLIEVELEKVRAKQEGKDEIIAALTKKVVALENQIGMAALIQNHTPQTFDIVPKIATPGKSESAAVAVWSDWHIEEHIEPEQVSGRNEYNLEVADFRFQKLCQGTLAWFNIENAKTNIKTLVIAALGDFITGSIHDDLAENNLLAPVDAIYKAQGMLASGIQFLLNNLPKDVEIIVVCHGGNHGRMTKEQRIATETGNSLEQYMYYTLRDHFQHSPRVKFVIAQGYHSIVRFFEGAYTVRFHHGHQINYWGGVGGITIPVNKAIAQWNKAETVNLDVFGHFHTRFDGGNFIANGSMIGYSPYAVSVKASYEKPSQTFFLINKEYGEKTMVAPIFME